MTWAALCRRKDGVPKGLVVFGVGVTTWLPNTARSGAERWFGCWTSAPRLLLLLIVELGWVSPVFGRWRSILASSRSSLSEGASNPKIRTLPIPPLARGCKFFDCQFSKWRRNCGKSRTRRMAPCGPCDLYKEGRSLDRTSRPGEFRLALGVDRIFHRVVRAAESCIDRQREEEGR